MSWNGPPIAATAGAFGGAIRPLTNTMTERHRTSPARNAPSTSMKRTWRGFIRVVPPRGAPQLETQRDTGEDHLVEYRRAVVSPQGQPPREQQPACCRGQQHGTLQSGR